MAKEEKGAAAPSVEDATAAEYARINAGGTIAGPADVTSAQVEAARAQLNDDDIPDDVRAAAGQTLVGLGPAGGDTPSVPTAANPSPGVAVGGIPAPTPDYVNTDLPAPEGAQAEAADNAAEGLAAARTAHAADATAPPEGEGTADAETSSE